MLKRERRTCHDLMIQQPAVKFCPVFPTDRLYLGGPSRYINDRSPMLEFYNFHFLNDYDRERVKRSVLQHPSCNHTDCDATALI